MPIAPIDACVVNNFWEALSPAELDCYNEAVAAFDKQHRLVERARSQQLERLRYEARLAEKQYRLIDPENRFVAAELERRWEQALQAVRQEEERASIAGVTVEPLAADLQRRWNEVRPSLCQMQDSRKLNNVRKKELLRVLIDKIVLKRPSADKCEIHIIWKGGNWSTVEFSLPVVTYAEMSNGEQMVSEVLQRARAGQRDDQITEQMTPAGCHAPLKRCLGVDSVVRIRQQHGVHSRKTEFLRQGLVGWITLGQTVEWLGEHRAWAYYLIRKKRLKIDRDSEIGLYLVRDNKRVLKDLKNSLRGERFSLILEPRSS